MTRTDLPTLLAGVPDLASPDDPFVYEVDGDRVVGRWDIVKATSLFPDQVRKVNKKYRLTVTFDADKGTYDFTDQSTSTGGSAGPGGASGSASFFKGKQVKKSFSFELGGAHKTDEGVSPVLAYSFDTARIKKPLLEHLEAHGWKPKSFLTRLFGR